MRRSKAQRKRVRRYRYRPGNTSRPQMLVFRSVLALIAVTALGLSIRVIAGSIRTAQLNRELETLHTVNGDNPEAGITPLPVENLTARAQGASYISTSSSIGKLSSMTMPDGSPIVPRETDSAADQDADLSTLSFHRNDLDILPDMLQLVEKNPDTAGWISISGVVDLPVVYRDNSYYLNHDFYGRKSNAGTLFLDQAHPLTKTTQNLLIHGHNMKDGSMFGILTHYDRLDFLRKHPLISFSTLREKETYAVFAVLQVSSEAGEENYFNYFSNSSFASKEAFDEYINQLAGLSKFSVPVNVSPTDALLTLSTCIGDDRLIVVARRKRPDESKNELIYAVKRARRN